MNKRELRIIILLCVVCLLVFAWWIVELRLENAQAKIEGNKFVVTELIHEQEVEIIE